MRPSATIIACLLAGGAAILCVPAGGSPAGSERSFFADAKLYAADAAPIDQFGAAVAFSGNTLVVGARLDDDAGETSGSAYVFERDAGGPGIWGPVAKLTAADGAMDDLFGTAVAISADVVVVGATGDDDVGDRSGSAYVFERDAGGPGAWGQVAKLTASDGQNFDGFGESVGTSGDWIVVGAATNDGIAFDAGAAYVYERDAGGPGDWVEVAKLTASGDAPRDDYFGSYVAISGATLVVAAPGDNPGSAYVFDRDGFGNWVEVAHLVYSGDDPFPLFPDAVTIDGDTIVAASSLDNPAGAIYIFERDAGGPGMWGQVARLTAVDADAFDNFGESVAIRGDTVVAGAPSDDDLGLNSGSAYVFQRGVGDPGNWGMVAKLTAAGGRSRDEFGDSVALDGGTVVVGAPLNDDLSSDAGTAYIFEATLVDPSIVASGACPGEVSLLASGLTPRGAIEAYSAPAEGVAVLASGPCLGTELGLEQPTLLGASRANSEGTKRGMLTLSEEQCGSFLQVIDVTSCATSTVVPVP